MITINEELKRLLSYEHSMKLLKEEMFCLNSFAMDCYVIYLHITPRVTSDCPFNRTLDKKIYLIRIINCDDGTIYKEIYGNSADTMNEEYKKIKSWLEG